MTKQKITFIITSVIYFPNKKLSYADKRSVFTPEQRATQPLETIKSIRDKVPMANIVLVELGMKKKIDASLLSVIDTYIYIGNNPIVKWAASGKYKGLGEAVGLLAAAKKIAELAKEKGCDAVISGNGA